jgi:hypothetical protein
VRGFRICFSDLRSGPRDACPNMLHDYPLPAGYGDAAEAASRRIQRGWLNKRCPQCKLYGWQPGRMTGDPCDERVPVAEDITKGEQ